MDVEKWSLDEFDFIRKKKKAKKNHSHTQAEHQMKIEFQEKKREKRFHLLPASAAINKSKNTMRTAQVDEKKRTE